MRRGPRRETTIDQLLTVLEQYGGLICGQVHPLEGSRLPVCARCSGIYFAYAFALLAMLAGRRGPGGWSNRRAPETQRPVWLALLLVSAAPLHAWFAPVSAMGWERMAAGAICGGGLAMLVGAGWPEAVAAAFAVTLAGLFPMPPLLDALAILTPLALASAVAVPVLMVVRSLRPLPPLTSPASAIDESSPPTE